MNEKHIKISGIVEESIVDGPGIRYTIFTQGCPHKCEGCHNPKTHPFEGGCVVAINDIYKAVSENPLLQGITFSGGEPFCQAKELAVLACRIKTLGKDVVTYSGYTFEELISGEIENAMELLSQTDILIDGKFVESKKDLTLNFRGSSNQRILNCVESIEKLKPVLL